jgi:hypothetical protein
MIIYDKLFKFLPPGDSLEIKKKKSPESHRCIAELPSGQLTLFISELLFNSEVLKFP